MQTTATIATVHSVGQPWQPVLTPGPDCDLVARLRREASDAETIYLYHAHEASRAGDDLDSTMRAWLDGLDATAQAARARLESALSGRAT